MNVEYFTVIVFINFYCCFCNELTDCPLEGRCVFCQYISDIVFQEEKRMEEERLERERQEKEEVSGSLSLLITLINTSCKQLLHLLILLQQCWIKCKLESFHSSFLLDVKMLSPSEHISTDVIVGLFKTVAIAFDRVLHV